MVLQNPFDLLEEDADVASLLEKAKEEAKARKARREAELKREAFAAMREEAELEDAKWTAAKIEFEKRKAEFFEKRKAEFERKRAEFERKRAEYLERRNSYKKSNGEKGSVRSVSVDNGEIAKTTLVVAEESVKKNAEEVPRNAEVVLSNKEVSKEEKKRLNEEKKKIREEQKERARREEERKQRAKEREEEAKRMTLAQYNKLQEEKKKKKLEAPGKVEVRKVVADEELQRMKLVEKSKEEDIFVKLGSEKEKLHKKNSLDKDGKIRKSLSLDEFLKKPVTVQDTKPQAPRSEDGNQPARALKEQNQGGRVVVDHKSQNPQGQTQVNDQSGRGRGNAGGYVRADNQSGRGAGNVGGYTRVDNGNGRGRGRGNAAVERKDNVKIEDLAQFPQLGKGKEGEAAKA